MAAPKPLPQRREYAASRTGAASEQARADLSRVLEQCPFLVGRLVSVQFVANTQKNVRHGLGVPAACIVVRQNYDPAQNAVRIGEYSAVTQATLDQRNVLALGTDVNCTLDLYFYPRASKDIDAGLGQSK